MKDTTDLNIKTLTREEWHSVADDLEEAASILARMFRHINHE